MPWHIGIDEAGYGPNLGPFVMTLVWSSICWTRSSMSRPMRVLPWMRHAPAGEGRGGTMAQPTTRTKGLKGSCRRVGASSPRMPHKHRGAGNAPAAASLELPTEWLARAGGEGLDPTGRARVPVQQPERVRVRSHSCRIGSGGTNDPRTRPWAPS